MSYPFCYRISNHANMSDSILFALRFYCSILLLLRLSFNVSIGLDEASCPRPWSYQYFLVPLSVINVDFQPPSRFPFPLNSPPRW